MGHTLDLQPLAKFLPPRDVIVKLKIYTTGLDIAQWVEHLPSMHKALSSVRREGRKERNRQQSTITKE
jgi:hypothetical protein